MKTIIGWMMAVWLTTLGVDAAIQPRVGTTEVMKANSGRGTNTTLADETRMDYILSTRTDQGFAVIGSNWAQGLTFNVISGGYGNGGYGGYEFEDPFMGFSLYVGSSNNASLRNGTNVVLETYTKANTIYSSNILGVKVTLFGRTNAISHLRAFYDGLGDTTMYGWSEDADVGAEAIKIKRGEGGSVNLLSNIFLGSGNGKFVISNDVGRTNFSIRPVGQANSFVIGPGGNVGVGTASPGASFEVNGGAIHIVGTPANPPTGSGLGLEIFGGSTPYIQAYNRNAGVYLPFQINTSAGIGFYQAVGGFVGIATTSPTNRLDVAGHTSLESNLYLNNLPTNASPIAFLAVDAAGQVFETATPSSSGSTNWLTDANGNGYGVNFFALKERNGIALMQLYSPTTTNGGNSSMEIYGAGVSAPFKVTGNEYITAKLGVNFDPSSVSANLEVAGTPGATNTIFHAGTNSANGLTVSSNGNVGIGTASPANVLQVAGTGFGGLVLGQRADTSLTSLALHFDSSTAGYSMQNASGNLKFIIGGSASQPASGTEVVRFGSTGNVGIGTTTPAAVLSVVGGLSVTTTSLFGGNIYAVGDVSALTFTDRSSAPDSLAEAVRIVKSHESKNGRVDHSKLDRAAWAKTGTNAPDQSKRDLSKVVSAQAMVIQDLLKRIEALEKK